MHMFILINSLKEIVLKHSKYEAINSLRSKFLLWFLTPYCENYIKIEILLHVRIEIISLYQQIIYSRRQISLSLIFHFFPLQLLAWTGPTTVSIIMIILR